MLFEIDLIPLKTKISNLTLLHTLFKIFFNTLKIVFDGKRKGKKLNLIIPNGNIYTYL